MDTNQNDPLIETNQSPVTPPPLTPVPETTPELPLGKPKSTSPIIPMLLGVVVVVIVSSFFAGLYYFSKLKKEVASVTPSPSPSVMASPTVEPSPTSTASASPKTSAKPVVSSATPKPSPSVSTSPTPVTSSATLDLRFGNPSAHIKQTYDDGTGDGRVINREFSSTQIGEFDELKASWAVKVTTCFHVVSNQDTEGSKLGYTLREDDKVIAEGTLSQYSKIEAGKTYDVCRDVSTGIGTHKIELTINNAKALGESTYANNTARIDYKNLADNIAPNFALSGPYNWNENGTCFLLNYPNDNVTEVKDLKIEHKIDSGDWVPQPKADYCFKGSFGSAHAYAVRMTDARGNKNEQSSNFNLY